MSYSSDLIDNDVSISQSFIAAPAYPSIFGITFSPIVSGIGIAAVGVIISGYLYMSYLQPQLAKNQELETKLSQTQDQIQQRKDNAKKIAEAEQSRDKVKAQKQIVTSLFASDKKLDTLLLDLNKLVNIRQGELQTFKPDEPAAGASGSSGAAVVIDSSLGAALNNKIKRKGVAVEVTGTFEQVQSILRTIERLDQLLLVKDFRADADASSQKIVLDAQGKVVPQPDGKIKTSFKIQALIPMNPAELTAAAPPPPPPTKK
jgi:type IV pilus assembly protein PilO